MILSNVHTHCTFCDGASTPEEVVQAAIGLGFTDIGFSSHSGAPFDKSCVGVVDEDRYIKDIRSLQQKYEGVIDVVLGIEQDTYAQVDANKYDYTIGSNHYLPVQDGRYIAVDAGYDILRQEIENRYKGNGLAMLEDFYRLLIEGLYQMKPTIVGHFDLPKKYNRDNSLFDENGEAYRQLMLQAFDEAIHITNQYGGIIEVNTGAITRGLRDDPYPSMFLLEHAAQRNARLIITSDSHHASTLGNYFDLAQALVKKAGISKVMVLKKREFIPCEI